MRGHRRPLAGADGGRPGRQYTTRHQPDLSLAALEVAARDARGSPARRYGYYLAWSCRGSQRNRLRADETDIADVRRRLDAAAQGDEEKDVAYATSFLAGTAAAR